MNNEVVIRTMLPAEYPLLEDFMYEAIHQPDPENPYPKELIYYPQVSVYWEKWGTKQDDHCLLATQNNVIAGAIWARTFHTEIKGYGYIDEHTPEIAMAVFKEYRNQGIGTQLIKQMINLLQEKNYQQVSLSISKGNPAVHLYERMGFRTIAGNDEDDIMLLHWHEHNAKNNLLLYGWNNRFEQLKQTSAHKLLPHGRVAVVHRTCYEVMAADGLFQCELTGNMMFGKSDSELPCVGDWVIFQPFDDRKGIVLDMLPRERTLYRRKSGTVSDRQAIASHVDKAFIVQSLDENFNVRRAERFLAQITEANIRAVLVLNKSDLGFDRDQIHDQLQHLARQVPIVFTSIYEPQSIGHLRLSITEGETVVFVGSSGVGKSSLVNALCGKSLLLTSYISESTGKGRHTSTRREMVLMEGSGVLIDTPGVREFGLAMDDGDSLAGMMEISDYAAKCRFNDCEHINEPGCAVIEALNSGRLDRKVYESYLKLRREALHFTASEHEKRRKEKSFSKLVDEVKKRKANY